MKLKFSAKGIKFLSHYQARLDIRYYLNGIYLKPFNGGVIGCASDGHTAGMWFDKDGHVDRPIIIEVTTQLVAACSKPSRLGEGLTVEVVDNRLAVMDSVYELFIQPGKPKSEQGTVDENLGIEPFEVRGSFPDLARVVRLPDGDRGPTDAVNPALLERVSKSFKTGGKFSGAVNLRQDSASNATLFTSSWMPEAAALLMPLRDQDMPPQEWLKKFASRSAA